MVFFIVCICGVLFIENWNKRLFIICIVVALTSDKQATDSKWWGAWDMEVSEIIKEARTKKGMTQQQLADCVYVTRHEPVIIGLN